MRVIPPVTSTKELVEIHLSIGVIPVKSSVSPVNIASRPNDTRYVNFCFVLLPDNNSWPAINPQVVCAPLAIKFIKLVL